MIQEKILKIAKGLGSFELDELLIISELPENNVIKEIQNLLKQNVIVKIESQSYRFLGYQKQSKTQVNKKKQRKLFSSPNLTFKGASNRFLKYHAKENCKPTTIVSYVSYLNNHLLPELGKLKLKDITPELIAVYKTQKFKDGLSEKTIKHILTLLNGIMELAVSDGAINRNPVNLQEIPKVPRSKVNYLNEKEINRVLRIARVSYHGFYPLLFTAIYTGLTRGELLGLTWDKIDFENKLIRVDRSLYQRKIIPIDIPARIRDVDMFENVSQVLSKWKEDYPKGEVGFVFPNIKGNAECADNMIARKFNPVITKAGVKKIKFNDLRDTYAVRLLHNNYPVEYVHKQMGFSSVVVTIDRYIEFL